ncbi:MAG: LytTR family DNA-binding domain-containing protein [Ignavibacteria bacterium]|jgi:two-component system LytT family response regulator
MKAVIIEDEPLAIENLKYYLKDYPITIAGSAYRIKEAVKLIRKEKPDIVFLDINLSGENGFDLLDKIEINFKLVFVTAYDEYALRAFEVNALDYLVKPLSKSRIAKTVKRLLDGNRSDMADNKFTIEDKIFLSGNNKAHFVKIKDICCIEAESCYSKIFLANGNQIVISRTLKKWEEILPQNEFIRVHRSYLLNINCIKEIKKRNNGTYCVYFNEIDKPIEISRRYASLLRHKLKLF